MKKQKSSNPNSKITLEFEIKNRNELNELLETIQKDVAKIKKDFDLLNELTLEFGLKWFYSNILGKSRYVFWILI